MKTGITIIETHQVGIDEWTDVKITKVFSDSSTICEIKEWLKETQKLKSDIFDIGISGLIISDIIE